MKGGGSLPSLVLVATAGPCKGAVFDDQQERRRIGRAPKGNTVVVKDASVSQRHAEVAWSGSEWTLTDVGSSNGTLLNDAELTRQGARSSAMRAASGKLTLPRLAAGEAHALKDGDVITLGDSTVLKVSITAAQAGAAAAPAPAPLGAAAVVPTVESFLNAQCEQLVARVRSQHEAHCSSLRADAEASVADLIAEETAA